MTSILKVSEIQDPTNANSALTVDTAGRVTKPVQPSFLARGHGGASYTNLAGVTLKCVNDIDHNIGSCYDTSNGRFTAPIAGRYVYGYALGICYINSASASCYPYIRKNGNIISYQYIQAASSTYMPISASLVIQLAVGDYITVTLTGTGQFYQDTSETMQYAYLLG